MPYTITKIHVVRELFNVKHGRIAVLHREFETTHVPRRDDLIDFGPGGNWQGGQVTSVEWYYDEGTVHVRMEACVLDRDTGRLPTEHLEAAVETDGWTWTRVTHVV